MAANVLPSLATPNSDDFGFCSSMNCFALSVIGWLSPHAAFTCKYCCSASANIFCEAREGGASIVAIMGESPSVSSVVVEMGLGMLKCSNCFANFGFDRIVATWGWGLGGVGEEPMFVLVFLVFVLSVGLFFPQVVVGPLLLWSLGFGAVVVVSFG